MKNYNLTQCHSMSFNLIQCIQCHSTWFNVIPHIYQLLISSVSTRYSFNAFTILIGCFHAHPQQRKLCGRHLSILLERRDGLKTLIDYTFSSQDDQCTTIKFDWLIISIYSTIYIIIINSTLISLYPSNIYLLSYIFNRYEYHCDIWYSAEGISLWSRCKKCIIETIWESIWL